MFSTDTLHNSIDSLAQTTSVSQVETSVLKPFFELSETVDANTFLCPSVFQEHALKPINDAGLPILNSFNEWFFAVLFLGLVLYAWIVSFNIKRVGQMMNAIVGNRGFNRLTREGDVFSEQLFFPLIVLIVLCFSLFAYRIGMVFNLWKMSEPNAIITYGKVMFSVGALYLGRVILVKIHAWIFKEQNAAHHYLLNVFVFNTMISLLLLPLLLVAFFGDLRIQTGILYAMFFLSAICYVWRGFRSFALINSLTKFSYFHNFLYLCTLEIGYYLSVYVVLNKLNDI